MKQAQSQPASDDNYAALMSAGVSAYRRGQLHQAASFFAKASEQDPSATASFNLATCQHKLAQPTLAAQTLKEALRRDPFHTAARRNLAEVLGALEVHDEAALHFAIAHKNNPADKALLQRALLHAAKANTGPVPSRTEPSTASPPLPHTSFVICSVSDTRFNRVAQSIQSAWRGRPYDIVRIGDARSLAEGYMRGLADAVGERIVFCHDDITFLGDAWPERLHRHLDTADVVGAAGTSRLTTPAVTGSGDPHVYGWVAHPHPGQRGRYVAGLFSFDQTAMPAQAIDGMLIATHRKIAQAITFDRDTFAGFHGYDIDFAYRAHRAGCRVIAAPDLWLAHDSEGDFGDAWRHAAALLQRKFPELNGTPKSPTYCGATVDSAEAAFGAYVAYESLLERTIDETAALSEPRVS